jgi:hypothetical protein
VKSGRFQQRLPGSLDRQEKSSGPALDGPESVLSVKGGGGIILGIHQQGECRRGIRKGAMDSIHEHEFGQAALKAEIHSEPADANCG